MRREDHRVNYPSQSSDGDCFRRSGVPLGGSVGNYPYSVRPASKSRTRWSNRGVAFLIAVATTLAVTNTRASADFTYSIADSQVTITGYVGQGGAVIVPAEIEGLPVYRIGSSAMSRKLNVTSVQLPSTLRVIQANAFAGCANISVFEIPASTINIAVSAFEGCSALTAINVASANSTYASHDGVLLNKSQTTLLKYPEGKAGNFVIPSTVRTIGARSFYDAHNMTAVSIPNGALSIGTNAFTNCRSLTFVAIPDTVTTIGGFAFTACSNLETVSIGSGVHSIATYAFFNCQKMQAITVSPDNQWFSSLHGVLYDKQKSTLIQFPNAKSGHLDIPHGVATIARSAFSTSKAITSVSFPTTLRTIGVNAFETCTGLSDIVFPEGLETISSGAFGGCQFGPTVDIPSTVRSIETSALRVSGLEAINVSDANAFYRSSDGILLNKAGTQLVQFPQAKGGSVAVPDGVVEIRTYSFYKAPNVTEVRLPDSCDTIGSYAFSFNTALREVHLGNGVTQINTYAFWNCTALEFISFPLSLVNLDPLAFSGCSSLKAALFQGNAPIMGTSVFSSVAPSFRVFIFDDAQGFTVPVWNVGNQSYLVEVISRSDEATLWLISHGLDSNVDIYAPPIAGQPNLLLCFALGLRPEHRGHLSISDNSENGSLTLSFYAGRHSLKYSLESSADLITWSKTDIQRSDLDHNGIYTFTLPQDKRSLFLRVVVNKLSD